MLELVRELAAINSYSYNTAGLETLLTLLREKFRPLGAQEEILSLQAEGWIDAQGERAERPLGRALSLKKRPEVSPRAFLCIHYDTVFSPERNFSLSPLENGRLNGPGVLDAKAGIVILLTALTALERSLLAPRLGWEVFLNPDEEIGSPGSAPLLYRKAPLYDLGLLFEPALPDGSLVAARKGSGNFTITVRGRAAHAGRDFASGRNALVLLSRIVLELQDLMAPDRRITVNPGRIEGGGPSNVVPDFALLRFNIRVADAREQSLAESFLADLIAKYDAMEGFRVRLHGRFHAPPKIMTDAQRSLLEAARRAGGALGLELDFQDAGGVCDGNKLAAGGLPNIDTLGARGAGAHSTEEYLIADSLTERAKLTLSLLFMLAQGEIALPPREERLK